MPVQKMEDLSSWRAAQSFSINFSRSTRLTVPRDLWRLFYPFQDEDVKWYEDQGCKLVKVCAEPGDLILWDSRQMHYAVYPETDTVRTIIYACYTPAALASKEDLALKKEIFEKWEATTHWPHINIHSQGKAKVDGKIDPWERTEPLEKPELTDKLLKLAGVKAY
jgi:ectoine hydroxylase-related dioxygenase (phytanoyl-CoA dioxygenase family)